MFCQYAVNTTQVENECEYLMRAGVQVNHQNTYNLIDKMKAYITLMQFDCYTFRPTKLNSSFSINSKYRTYFGGR